MESNRMDQDQFWGIIAKACRSDLLRCWLIGMSRDVYEAAVANPDSLADVVDPQIEAEAEIYAAAHRAWMAVTGRSDTDSYPARSECADLRGDDWDFDEDGEVRRRLPRLAAISGQ
jgi:hypothetical protein